MESAFPVAHEGVVDGITTFWTDLPPPLTASLLFRVGQWDESILARGCTHLVEHLALHPLRRFEKPYGGSVTGNFMALHATGSASDLAQFFGELSASLRSLPLDRLEKEAGVLIAEDATRQRTWDQHLLLEFFGPNGPGVTVFPENGLECLEPGDVQAWADRYCVRENAVLMLTAPPPATLGIDLPEGAHRPFVLPPADLGYRPERLELLHHQMDGVCLGALAARTTGSALSLEILTRRLTDRLRHDLGLVYGVASSYLWLDADTAFFYAGADARQGHARETASGFMEVVRALRDQGPTEEEVETIRRFTQTWEEQAPADRAREELNRVGIWRLLGYEQMTPEELSARRMRVTSEDIGSTFGSILEHGGVVAPEHLDLGLPERVPRSDEPTEGTSFRRRPGGGGDIRRLIVGPTGLSCQAHGRWATLTWDGLVVAERVDPHTWGLQHENGVHIQVGVRGWWRRRKLQRLLEEYIPRSIRLPDAVVRKLHEQALAKQQGERKEAADAMVASLRKKGFGRTGTIEELMKHGFTNDEADAAWERG